MKLSLLLGFVLCSAQAFAHGAHVHGVGVMTIAAETPLTASVNFVIPTDSIFGFEHEVKTAADKKTRDQALDKMKSNLQTLISFDSKLNCKAKLSNLTTEPEKDDDNDDHDHEIHGQHQNLKLNFTLGCAHELAGSSFKLAIMKLFPRIKTVKVQVLTDVKQTAVEVKGDNDAVPF